jgi:two-component system CheB/CheR fusion protein
MAKREKNPVSKTAPDAMTISAQDIAGKAVEGQETVVAGFPIVGIGASAGGLAAFEAFFSSMPADTDPGMAFVLVQHLAPDHKSILTDLIRRYTRMQVFEVEDGMAVLPNCAFIIPPGYDMAFLNGKLHLLEPSAPRGQRLPIDFFFRSLAQDQHERAVCIVLSGTGSDGTLGVRAIKGEGGMVMVQTPESTEYDGMPRSALGTGLVDYELPPAEMPAQLIAYATHAFGKSPRSAAVPTRKGENTLKKIFILLRAQTGHDFSQYKPSTIHRRIERRMAVQQIDTMDGYAKFLHSTPLEAESLFRDLLIGVTNFFRDPEAFRALEEQVIPRLFGSKSAGAVIRVWSLGCSTGEEAYSLAILMQEHIEMLKQSFKVQIFATDIDSRSIAAARIGLYPASIAADISPERLSRFFTADPDGSAYRIHKYIRDMLVFSEQDMIKDPPFSKIDLISCRNVLIYMDGQLQKKLIPLFHYALNPGGFLFLGTSETVGEFSDLFTAMDRKSKLYHRRDDTVGSLHMVPDRLLSPTVTIDAARPQTARMIDARKLPLRDLTERALLQQVAPAAVLVNGQGDILYLHGRTGLFLELAPGEAAINNILKMAREGLRRDLTSALHTAAGTKEIVRYAGLRIKTNGDFTTVNLTVRPVTANITATQEAPLYLIILEEVQPFDQAPQAVAAQAGAEADGPDKMDTDSRIVALKQELRAKEESLQTANEELETSNEELKSSNEEMQSVNEELQSTNEELETSKEELQSINEELATVNNELQTKVADLSRANNDMNNLLAGTGIGTIFVNHQMRILRFTPAAARIINLIRSDIGRPVNHIVNNLVNYDHLVEDVKTVLDTLVHKEIEVQTTESTWYLMRIMPYRTIDNVIEGAVITFTEITEIKKAYVDIMEMKKVQDTLRESEDRFKKLFEEAPLGIALIDSLTGHIYNVNPMFARIAGRTMEEMLHINWMSITHTNDVQKDIDNMARLNAGEIDGFQMEKRCLHPNGNAIWINMTIASVKVKDTSHPRHLCMIEDITVHKRTEETLRKANDQLRLAVVVRDSRDAVTVQDLEGRIITWNPGAVRIYGWSEAEALAMNVHDRIPEGLRKDDLTKLHLLSQQVILEPYFTQRLTKDGSIVEVSIVSTALVDEAGQMYAIATTERVKSDGGA